MAKDTIFEAVFATIKGDAVTHYFAIYAENRDIAARRIATNLKTREEGSLLDMALADADDVRAAIREVPMSSLYV
jgi:hypothetical protein